MRITLVRRDGRNVLTMGTTIVLKSDLVNRYSVSKWKYKLETSRHVGSLVKGKDRESD
jgi:hypothetical protein